MKHVKLSKITYFFETIASVRKELRPYMNALMTSHCHLSVKYECCVSQRSVKTLIMWGGKRLHHIMANLIRKYVPKLSEWVLFCTRYDRKHFGVFFSVHSVVPVSENKWLLCWIYTSGFYFLRLHYLGMSFCTCLPNFVQICDIVMTSYAFFKMETMAS